MITHTIMLTKNMIWILMQRPLKIIVASFAFMIRQIQARARIFFCLIVFLSLSLSLALTADIFVQGSLIFFNCVSAKKKETAPKAQ